MEEDTKQELAIEDSVENDSNIEDKKTLKKKEEKRKARDASGKKRKINKKNLSIFGILLLTLILLFFIFYFVFVPKITLEGRVLITLDYGEKYEEPGYKASYMGKDITEQAWVVGKVDSSKLGTYVLKYKVQKNKITTTKERVVKVVDKKAPEITLEGDVERKICPNKEYQEDGFNAVDNYDGDVTLKVKSEVKNDKVIYTVKDSSGNKATVERKLIKEDAEGPKITLKGNSTIYMVVNTSYNEPGYEAIDECEGDLTDKVIVSGKVNTSATGTYTLTYTVTDGANNTSTVTRSVVVQQNYQKISSNYTCGEAGVIYLTFDDGPDATYTKTILDVLKKYNVNATFFVLGSKVNSNKELIKREIEEGHAIGIHTWSHDYATVYKSSDNFWNEVTRTKDAIKNVAGYDTYLIRFPGGVSNTVSRHYSSGIMTRLANEALSRGFNYYDWNISSGDAGGTTDPNVELNNVTSQLSKSRGNVVLMHDIKNHTARAIESIVKYGLEHGYKFKTLDSSVICRHSINN